MLVFMFGEVDELVAHEGQLLDAWHFSDGKVIKPETNDYAGLLLRMRNGMVINLQVSWSATVPPGWTLEAFGSKGRFAAHAPSFPTSRDTTLHAGTIESGRMEKIQVPPRFLSTSAIAISADAEPQPAYPMALSMAHMAQAIRGEGAASPDFEQVWPWSKFSRLRANRRRSCAG